MQAVKLGCPSGCDKLKYFSFAGLVVPSVTASTLQPAVAIMGAVIMPHNIYLHSSLTLSRQAGQIADMSADVMSSPTDCRHAAADPALYILENAQRS